MASADAGVLVSILILVGASASLTATLWIVDSWPKRQSVPDSLAACPLCSYSFAGLAAQSPCPECGAPFERQRVVAQHKARLRLRDFFPIGVLLTLALGFAGTALNAYLSSMPRPREAFISALFYGVPFALLICTIPAVARRTSRANLIIWTALGTMAILIGQAQLTWHITSSTDSEAGLAVIGAPCFGTVALAFGLLVAATALHNSSRRQSQLSE